MDKMTPSAWVRAQLTAVKPLAAMTADEAERYFADQRASAQAAFGAEAESALRLLRLVRNGAMTEAELPA